MTRFTDFLSDDAGAVTIDWVALGSAILLLGIMVVYSIFNNGVSTLVSNVNSTLTGVVMNVAVTAPSPGCLKTAKGIKCRK